MLIFMGNLWIAGKKMEIIGGNSMQIWGKYIYLFFVSNFNKLRNHAIEKKGQVSLARH